MSTLFFLVILACNGVVLAWYALNESKGADGELGLLAIAPDIGRQDDQPEERQSAYQIKERGARPGLIESEIPAPAYMTVAERKAFKPQSGASYRPKTGSARYGVKPRTKKDPVKR